MIASRLVKEFIQRLKEAEEKHDANHLSRLFAADADLQAMTSATAHTGSVPASALTFWNQYLRAFDQVSSHFTSVIEASGYAILEWESQGRLPMGINISYKGVTILQLDESGESIIALRVYYDSAALLPHAPDKTKSYSESVGLPRINTEASS